MQLFEGEEAQIGLGTGGEHFVGDESGGFVGRNAAVFLEPLLLIDALGVNASEESFRRFVPASFFIDALDQTLGDGGLDGDGVQGPGGGEGRSVRAWSVWA